MPQFVIINHDAKNEMSSFKSTKYYTLNKRRKFLWIEWWSPVKENGKVCMFKTEKEALEKFKTFKKPK